MSGHDANDYWLQNDGGVKFAEIYGDIPAYVILSHIWGAAVDEIVDQDMKIRFCIEKVANDGLRYFWIDTCCIDKSSSAELSEAINSMFRWYQNAAKYYAHDPEIDHMRTLILEQRIYKGWTLQKLLAPAIVEPSLTQITHGALEGHPLSSFSVDERMSWTMKRKTDEDAAYCLFGLFDLHMSLLYGEGRERAFIRLLCEIQNDQEADMPPGLEQALVGP
ncbi:uncharacterized protein CC84DRAFT_1188723 [Paraphaeosphaeria sporulosa]|uniref:Heterokaryon incompatibility domain-containing protein n=1 Tax=Paraphaeosphaeria sporulosa TaxID=1460663 RepID=A0A177C5W0_9PLEO|nr:uncharacterized protein CC84DRAFT_1188723 [Paraphaeosphaeria sporulosa]OAG02531.1 hypothetical protein CC84DRAFT_1188723 [Paraphaeosphaeria sporulosa]